jgi:hypothetical protein
MLCLFFRNVFGETERGTVKRFLSTVITVFVFVVLAYLPVIPVSIAPVVLNATYSTRMVNFRQILWFSINRPDGVSYQWHWYTYAVILVLLAIGCLASAWAIRKIGGSSNN